MSIATAIIEAQGRVANAYTAISNKGGTLPATQNLANMPAAINSIPSGGSTGKYQLLERVKDDNNNEIGTVSGFFTDANDVEYAVVCLDAQYRLEQGAYCSNNSVAVTDLPLYGPGWSVWEAKETSTFNTQKILDFCSANGYTSSACSHCRSKSFTIDGIIYYGQLPCMEQLLDICEHGTYLQSVDTSASQYSNLGIPRTSGRTWSSSQFNSGTGWLIESYGIYSLGKQNTGFIIPVLELPNA